MYTIYSRNKVKDVIIGINLLSSEATVRMKHIEKFHFRITTSSITRYIMLKPIRCSWLQHVHSNAEER